MYGYFYVGGAIVNGGTLSVNGCTFTGNTANDGGAIYNQGGTINSVSGCIFKDNKADDGGGAIKMDMSGDIKNLSDCTFIDNTAVNGGAINNVGTINSLNGCTFTGNTAVNGGAIYNLAGTISLSDCNLTNNTATSGGAICNDYYFLSDSKITLDGCNITQNTATTYGGAIYNGGSLTANYNRFYNNTATDGKAIYSSRGSVNANYNWWSSNKNPKSIDKLIYDPGNLVNATYWVILSVNAALNSINNTQTSIITADLNHYTNSTGYVGILSTLIPDGIQITFSSYLGSFNPGNPVTSGGNVATTFTPSCYSGLATIHTTVDDFNLDTPFTVTNSNIYVSNNTGSDTTGDGSQNKPYQTIKKGISTVTTGGTIHIANGQYTGENNTNITLDKNMNIIGESQTGTIINGTGTNWIFAINPGVTVTITNLTLTNGKAGLTDMYNYQNEGGAICNFGTLSVSGCTFVGNTATGLYGGAGGTIYNEGTINSVNGCTFIDNTATTYGGAIYNDDSLTANYNRFYNNTAPTGNAIYSPSGSVDANYNWWGSNKDPKSIDMLIYDPNNLVDTTNWVILTINANPTTINNTQTSIITADLNHYTNSTDYVGELSNHIPDGTITLNALGKLYKLWNNTHNHIKHYCWCCYCPTLC